MPNNHHLEELQLFKGIDKILRSDWLPRIKLPPSQYRQCHREVFRLALGDMSLNAIAQYLRDIAMEKANWQSDVADHMPAAESIFRLKKKTMSK